ncbi:MAG: hypothetical protein M1549_00490 [Candidatus Dependentiae bacterium]|nr:hypothetical protein [Candidatus Dependentiae bacterium]
MKSLFRLIFLCAVLVSAATAQLRAAQDATGSCDAVCSFVAERFDRIGARLGNSWDVLGILRSITIQPEHRTRFLATIVGDAMGVLEDVSQLSACCALAPRTCRRFIPCFEDVADRFIGVVSEFDAVCKPTRSRDELLLGLLVERAARLFNECWVNTLKVDPALKAEE